MKQNVIFGSGSYNCFNCRSGVGDRESKAMSLFHWFKRTTLSVPRQSRLAAARLHADASMQRAPAVTAEMAQQHRNERLERREQLYAVVRDAMVRAGVLSASYKFKVLALDQRGHQFLVMMDLAREYGGQTARLNDIEGLIAQTAKTRHGVAVAAVYWRINDHIVAAMAHKGLAPGGAGLPAPLPAQTPAALAVRSADAEAGAEAEALPMQPGATGLAQTQSSSALPDPSFDATGRLVAPRFDPIEADEVAAFKRALANAAAARTPGASAQSGTAAHSGLQRQAAPNESQFPDTVLPQPSEQRARNADLSSTQYGEL